MGIQEIIKERDEALAKCAEFELLKIDAEKGLESWFDTGRISHESIDPIVMAYVAGYLRRCVSGGMEPEESNMVQAVINEMCMSQAFSSIFKGYLSDNGPASSCHAGRG
ncbi:hypothetical protein ACFOY8_14565 [Thalassospira xianhensis]|uniref:Uncharacterized protein n=1 Tax=Thalassospira xianhensis MCCC 1A02616 TaxID=1177929 RepID=A0A367UIZ7_9PROT|nr:hypothetical protein [Thalassospira xianhensis]RCK07623.1 hypothetical protein TH5_00675 [Thalassospira xianhensis MCCC 1A02616]